MYYKSYIPGQVKLWILGFELLNDKESGEMMVFCFFAALGGKFVMEQRVEDLTPCYRSTFQCPIQREL